MTTYKCCLKKSPTDHRDISVSISKGLFTTLPVKVDLKPLMPPPLDQLNLGSCALNAASNCIRYLLKKQNLQEWQPSRLYLYYNTRVLIEKSKPDEDTGVSIRDVCKSLSKYHSCPETMWPYIITKFSEIPPIETYNEANLHKKIKYAYVPLNLNSIKHVLSDNNPIIIGIQLYDSFKSDEVAKTGIVPIPNTETETLMGGHAMLCVGYCDESKLFTILNSWGDSWGSEGYCYIPYDYILDPKLSSDFWTISLFE